MAPFDPSTWYQLTESQAGLGSGMAWGAKQVLEIQPFNASTPACRWQLSSPISNSTPEVYILKNQGIGPKYQVTSSYNPNETDTSHTQPGFAPADPYDQSQMWLLSPWGEYV